MKSCVDCSNEFPKEELNRKGCCLNCAVKRMRDAAEQMSRKEGPYWEKWLLAKEKAVARYRATMERTIKHYEEALNNEEYLASPLGQAEMQIRIGHLFNALEDSS